MDEADFQCLRDATAAEMREHMDTTMESLIGKLQLVIDILAQLDAKIERNAERLMEEMRQGFAETRALFGFPLEQRSND